MTRRRFVGAVAAAALSGRGPGGVRRRRLKSIGLQLYSVRGALQQDFEGTLARVAEIGYREVEFAGYFDRSPAEIRAMLDRHGLVAPSAHLPYEQLAAGWDQALDAARRIGHQYAVVAWIPEQARRDLDGWKRVADQFNRAGEACRRVGLEFAFHNHSYEFVPLGGQLPYDVLVAATDPRLVRLEMDLFWVATGRQDPLGYFRRFPGRFPLVHVKDMAAGPERKMADVGQGIIDWKGIFAQSELAGIKHYFVEHDEPPQPFDDIRVSFEYLKRLEF